MKIRNFNWPAFRELTCGTGGVGKSTAFTERLKRQKARVIWIYDHKHEFCQKLRVRPVYYMCDLIQATVKGGPVCFDPCQMFPGDKKTGFTFFCQFVYDAAAEFRGRKILVADELQAVHDFRVHPFELMLCLDDGRNFELDFMGICQGVNKIYSGIRAQITEAYTFRQCEKNALSKIQDYGFDPKEVANLRPGEWQWRNLNTGQAAKGGKAFQIKPARAGTIGAVARR